MTIPDKIILPLSDEKLLEECEIQTFRSSGKGGQHVNKTESAVRLRHLPSHLVVFSQKERSQYLNKLDCIRKLREKVIRLNRRAKVRIPTQKPKSAKEKVLKKKAILSQKKRLRMKYREEAAE